MPRRISFITTGLGTGGAERILFEIVTRLDREHFIPTVVSLTTGGKYAARLAEAHIEVLSLDMPAGTPTLGGLRKLRRFIRSNDPDVLVGWMYHGCLAAHLARFAGRRRVPIIWNIRQTLYSLRTVKRGSAAVILSLIPLARQAAAVVYNSELAAQQHERLGFPASKRVVISNGFDVERWRPRVRVASDCVRIGRFGRYVPMKDFDTFLQAARLILESDRQCRFVLAGTGVTNDNVELVQMVSQLGLAEHVELLGERDDMEALTASLDIAVSSSAFDEGLPNVVGEAMACSVPVVATDIGDSARLVGSTGSIVPPRSPRAIADACLHLIRMSSDERQRRSNAARSRIETDFSISNVTKQFEAVLSSV